MIRIELSANALASTRFGLSPLMEIGTVVNQWQAQARRGADWAPEALDLVRDRDLRLLGGFMAEHRGYVPDFLNPLPEGYEPDLDRELHQVAGSAAEQVAAEMTDWVRGRTGSAALTPRFARPVLDCLQRGEQAFAHRIADELATFWAGFLAPRWPSVRRGLEADVDRRARAGGRDGIASVLTALGPGMRWRDGGIDVDRPYEQTACESTGLLLIPSTMAGHVGVGIDPLCRRSTHIVYPVARGAQPNLGDVLGHTRTALLLDLDVPRTTTELAGRGHLAVSTVSYHLGRLHRAGLVTKSRTGATVHYRRSGVTPGG